MTIVDTRISSVTVYIDRARITRCGSIALEAGSYRLEAPNLPLRLDPASLRAMVSSGVRTRLLGVLLKRAYFSETQSEVLRGLEHELEMLQDELHRLERQNDLLQNEREAVKALSFQNEAYAKALAWGDRDINTHLQQMKALRDYAMQLDNELGTIASQRRESERRAQQIKSEIERWRSVSRNEQYTAIIEVEMLEAGELNLELTYAVAGASWQPLYDFRLIERDPLKGDMAGSPSEAPIFEVSYLAQVRQETGEAWDDVDLTLSTARPALSGKLPELQPWFLAPRAPLPVAGVRMAATPALMKSHTEDTAAGRPEEADSRLAEMVTAEVGTSGAAVTYHLPVKASVPTDGEPHKVAIANFHLPPRLDYVGAPKIAESVHRRAKVVNDSPYTMLPGTVNLFAGDEFVGSVPLKLCAPGDSLELYLGVDDRMKIKRELVRREVDKRLIGNRRRVVYGYRISVQNLTPSVAEVVVKDQAPVGRHEDIKTRLETADPRPSSQDELQLMQWEFALAPKEVKEIKFEFSIEYPTTMEIPGLP